MGHLVDVLGLSELDDGIHRILLCAGHREGRFNNTLAAFGSGLQSCHKLVDNVEGRNIDVCVHGPNVTVHEVVGVPLFV